jgi:hypothetical protein
MIPVLIEYSNSEWGFPSKDIDPTKKGAEYHRKVSQAVYSLFLRNKCSWGITGYKDFAICRDYSRGEQDVNQYKSWLLNESLDDGASSNVDVFDDSPVGRIAKREGWMSLMWQNISPGPYYMNAIHGMFDRLDFDIYADTIDANSKALKEEQKFIKLCEAKNSDWQVQYKKNAGIPVDEEVVLPRSPEELAMFEARDGFKLNIAKAMQKLTRHSMNISDWDGTVRKKVIDDLVCLNYGAVRDYFDSEDSKWKVKYIDPARLVMQFSNEYDYKDSEYTGYFCYWTISNLRNKLPDVPEAQWQSLAKACYTLYGNPRDRWQNFYSEIDPTTGTYRYDGFKVPIFECEWIDTDVQKKLYYKSFRGRDSIIDLRWDAPVKELSKEAVDKGASQEVKHIFKRVVRQCFWVLNTDYVFDYGVVPMASREGLSKPQLSFHVEQLLQPSLIKRMIPILDQISQLFLRWQNSLAMMIERGYAINTSMLANVTFGGQKLKPAEVLKLWQQTGRLLYSYANTPTGLYSGGAATPVVAMEGGLGARVEETMQAMQMQFTLLERLTGINLLSLSTPSMGEEKGMQDVQLQATSNVLKPILDAIFEIKGSAATSLMRRIQIGIRNNDTIREAYAGIISPSDMDAMLTMEKEGVQYGINLKAKPDEKQKRRFIEWVNIALQNVREQRPGIDLPDAMYFETALERGEDMYELIEQVRYIIEKNKQEAQQATERNMQVQAEQNAKAEQMKQQGQMAIDNNVNQGKMKEEMVRGDVKARQTTLEQNYLFLEALRQAADAEQGINTQTSK